MTPEVSLLFPRLAHPDDAVAFDLGDTRLSYREVCAAGCAHASALLRTGLERGNRVAVWTHHATETLIALVGNALAGLVSVPLNPAIGDNELEHVLRDAAPRRVLAADPAAVAHRTPLLPVEPVAKGTSSAAISEAARAPVSDDPMLVVYTSGTTGAPKGAVITVRNVVSNIDALARAWAWSDRDVLVHALPVFHVHGLVLGLFGTLRVGAALRWHKRFEPSAIAAEFHRSATMLFAVPTMYYRLAEAAERDSSCGLALGRARLLVSGSAPLPLREHARIERATGLPVFERYGLTETLMNCAVRYNGPRRAGYVGPPIDGIELRLVDDQRAPLSVHDDATLGEVCVRGPNVFAGYLNRPDATAAVRDADGWFYTGDLATVSPEGFVRIVGRKATDLIKTGGFKVGAGEVEAALLAHESVREAAVIAVQDNDLGERIVAYVVPQEINALPAESVLIDHVAQTLAAHKRPRTVRFVTELPRNAMGKVLKAALRTRETA